MNHRMHTHIEQEETIEVVRCMKCTQLFNPNSNEFYSIHGNIYKGLDGGLVGNNLDETNHVKKISILCEFCLIKVLYFSK